MYRAYAKEYKHTKHTQDISETTNKKQQAGKEITMKKISVSEQVKAEVSAANTKKILEEMEDSLSRIATRVEIDEDDGVIRLDGMAEKVCQANAVLRLDAKNDKYTLSGDVIGKADNMFWIIFGVGCLFLLISFFAFGIPCLVISIGIDVALIVLLGKGTQKLSQKITEQFRDAVKELKK